MDLQLPIKIQDELTDDVVEATGLLDLASGEIRNVQARREDYEFTCGTLSNGSKEVEFRIEVDRMGQKYSITTDELLELKGRAAKLFTAPPPGAHAPEPAKKTARKTAAKRS